MIKHFLTVKHLPYGMLFLVSLSSSIMPPLIGPLFISQYGILPHESQYFRLNAYGFTVGFYFIGTIIGSYIWGAISDNVGTKKTLLYCLVGSIFSYLICIYALVQISFVLFMLGRTLDGIMSGRRAVILAALSQLKTPKNTVFRVAELFNAGGLLIGPILSSLVLSYADTAEPLYYYSGPLLVVLFLTIINIAIIPLVKEDRQTSQINLEEQFHLKKIMKQSVIIEYFFLQMAWYLFYIAILPFSILRMKFNSFSIGVFFSSLVLAYMLFLAIQKSLMRTLYFDVKVLALVVLIVSLIIMGQVNAQLMFFTLLNIGVVFSYSLLNPHYTTIISKISNESNQGKILGIQSAVNAVSSAIVALLSGSLMNISLNLPFYIAGGFALLVFLLVRLKSNG
ncbi:MFS transporter [Legionella jordanis]|uniref:Transporter of the major facilitator superfamily (MFS) n=1 Tax=Legionella jordanis TaxID=456 RepID=A0A0W0V9R1_9GAMM|nr:MFS transporter [Legionella jordanis]KTD16885.1 transporter of the major facilitator superfamily (MFS) [Legionella jordanis]RMX00333.1 MFS transporter [Legionella jordanis]RMX15514.1 MFS transporter [Legionella jordanis]VEH13582.1 transporter of the major facilitator superfamily (MFS) [Legionella jordanis]